MKAEQQQYYELFLLYNIHKYITLYTFGANSESVSRNTVYMYIIYFLQILGNRNELMMLFRTCQYATRNSDVPFCYHSICTT